MPGEERYDDEHRIFLQGLMCKGILNFKVEQVIISCHRQTTYKFKLPSAIKERLFYVVRCCYQSLFFRRICNLWRWRSPSVRYFFWWFAKVCAIHCDILVRIRIRGSVPVTYGSGSCVFRQWQTRCQQKKLYFQSFFAYYFLKGTFTSVFKDEKLKRSQI